MRSDKRDRALQAYGGFRGERTVADIMGDIPADLEQLTGAQYGMVMRAVSAAYHKGRKSMGAEVVDGDMVWTDKTKSWLPLSVFARLSVQEGADKYVRKPIDHCPDFDRDYQWPDGTRASLTELRCQGVSNLNPLGVTYKSHEGKEQDQLLLDGNPVATL